MLNKSLPATFLSFLLLFFFVSNSFCGEIKTKKSLNAAFWWGLFVPGGGYFYLGETAKGLSYFSSTAGLLGWGIGINHKKADGEINTPLIYAQQLHVAQIYLSYREAHFRFLTEEEKRGKKILLERSSLSQLASAPFKTENLKNPWVIGFALLGAGLNYASARIDGAKKDFSDISHVQILGERFSRAPGFGVYSAYWIPISLGAGVSEEALFRGMVQTEWEERWGKRKGLLAASALFGAAHFDGKRESIGNVLFAAVAGLFLGWRFQEKNYQLGEPIAEHFWFDAIAGTTLYFADPDNNPLGAKVEFAF